MTENRNNYHLMVCEAVASLSKCKSRQIGAILVRDKSIISTGYNGPPREVPHCGTDRIALDYYLKERMYKTNDPILISDIENKCPRQIMGFESGDGLNYCPATHAEQNCIANAARMGINTLGSALFMNDVIPCKTCLAILINAGVYKITVKELKLYDPQSEYLITYGNLSIKNFEGKIL